MRTTLILFYAITISAALCCVAERSHAASPYFSTHSVDAGLRQYVGVGYFSGTDGYNEGLEFSYLGAFDAHHVKLAVTNLSDINYSENDSPFSGVSVSYGYSPLDHAISPYIGAGLLSKKNRTYRRNCQSNYPRPCEENNDYSAMFYPEAGVMLHLDTIMVSVFARRYFSTDADSEDFNSVGFNFLWRVDNWWDYF